MQKFLKISASSTGDVLVGLDNIVLVSATTSTVVLTYSAGSASADICTITHTTDATLATRQAFYDAIQLGNEASSNPTAFVVPVLPAGVTVSTVVVA